MLNVNGISEYLNKETDYLITKKTRVKGFESIESDRLDIFYINKDILKLTTEKGIEITLDLNEFCVYCELDNLVICSQSVYILVSPVAIKYPNLEAEIIRSNLSYRIINLAINREDGYIQDVLNCKEDIDLNTALKLREILFENLTLEYLFANKPIQISA